MNLADLRRTQNPTEPAYVGYVWATCQTCGTKGQANRKLLVSPRKHQVATCNNCRERK